MLDLVAIEPVDYLLIGHLTEDLTPTGPRLGGTVAYSGLTARALGLRVGIVTSAASSTDLAPLRGIPMVVLPSVHTTTFENTYTSHGRVQTLHHQAAPIPFDAIPSVWRSAPIVHLGPVVHEIDPSGYASGFGGSLLGITPQGWMRTWDDAGRVSPQKWASAETLGPQAGAAVISREDISSDEEAIEALARHTRLLAVTEGPAGCVLYWNGDRRRFRAPETEEVDGTGAGDIFATALFYRLYATRDPWEAARFATRLAAYSVTRTGLDGIPTKKEIDESLMEVLS